MQINPKVAATGIAGAIVTLIAGVLAMLGVDIPQEVVAAATTLLGFGVGYVKADAALPTTD